MQAPSPHSPQYYRRRSTFGTTLQALQAVSLLISGYAEISISASPEVKYFTSLPGLIELFFAYESMEEFAEKLSVPMWVTATLTGLHVAAGGALLFTCSSYSSRPSNMVAGLLAILVIVYYLVVDIFTGRSYHASYHALLSLPIALLINISLFFPLKHRFLYFMRPIRLEPVQINLVPVQPTVTSPIMAQPVIIHPGPPPPY